MTSIYDFSVLDGNGAPLPLSNYRSKVLLIVNVASRCGFTPQYEGLQRLYTEHQVDGFEILAFPCNQFGSQEPGNQEEIQSFCTLTYNVTFPLMQKIDVNGENAEPLYDFLKSSAPGIFGTEAIKWNFTKFLIDRNGHVISRHAPTVSPEALSDEIKQLLQQSVSANG